MKKTKNRFRDIIAEDYPDANLLFMDPSEDFDEAIIGVCTGIDMEPKIAYDYDKIIKANMKSGITYEDAVEHFEYNQIGSYVGEHTPVFIRTYNKTKRSKI